MGENIFSKTIPVLLVLCALMTQQTLGQIADDFSDGDFSSNPVWSGTTANYVVNAGGRLQLNAPVAGSSFMSLPFSIPANHNAQWEFVISQNFAPSNQNLSRVYLMADTQDPITVQNGYFLQFGETGSSDPIELFRISGGNTVSILEGTAGFVAAAFNIRVRVTRSSTGSWEIFADNAAGTNFTSQAQSVIDNTIQNSSFFIVRSMYTALNVSNFSYDDFIITATPAPDVTAPTINNVTIINASEIKINFSEALNSTNLLTAGDFILNDTVAATSAMYDDNNLSIRLTFNEPMVNGRDQKIHFPALSDVSDNILTSGNHNFLFFQPVAPQLHDLVINEIYADPSPSIGLPEFEFVEIFNRSQHPFQLSGWQLTDGTTTATLNAKILLPGEYITVTPNAAAVFYSALGTTMGVPIFPSLNNSGDNLQLKNPEGALIDGQNYSLAWYHDEDKDAGGFSIERIDPTNFCRGADNWKASTHAIGGTPGTQNSVWQITQDVTGPKLLEVIPKTSNTVTLKFDERMSDAIPPLENFGISGGLEKTSASFSNATLMEVDLEFASDLDSAIEHTITLAGFFDCPGNPMESEFGSASFKMDNVKPTLVSISVLDQSRLQLLFSEKIVTTSITPDAILPEQSAGPFASEQSDNKKLVTLTFESLLTNGKDYGITIRNLTDLAGNQISEVFESFRFFEPQPLLAKDVVINELLADQSPVVGLPDGEFIEIYNRSEKAYNLLGWKITDGSTIGVLPDKIILPHEYVILCPSVFAAQFANFGPTVGLSVFPSLNNSGDMLKLVDGNGVTIDSIHYFAGWYQHDDKQDGGWSIERINPNDFCGQAENWKASEHTSGGTPGAVNSLYDLTEDASPPDLINVSVPKGDSIVVHFTERLSVASAETTNFLFEPALEVDTTFFADSGRRNIVVELMHKLDSSSRYQLHAQNIFDCPGNQLPLDSSRINFKLDSTLPFVNEVTALSATTVLVNFSEKISTASATGANFVLEGAQPTTARKVEGSSVELTFNPPLVNGKKYQLSVSNIFDLAENAMVPALSDVLFFEGNPVYLKDIIISEIFADPSPVIGLPETEYIEIYNRSGNPVQLEKWNLADEKNRATIPDRILLPNEHLVLTLSSKAFQFTKGLGLLSFPTLTNSGEPLVLKDSLGVTIDSVFYSDAWYNDSEKQDGGWSLEIIDPNNICSEGENWSSSIDSSGGTPGRVNSVIAEKPDLTAPVLASAFALSPDTVVVEFNEKLDKQLPTLNNVSISPALIVDTIMFSDQSKRGYAIALSTPMEKRVRYKIELANVVDCAGNVTASTQEIVFALTEEAEPGDIVINEILFNPRPTGVDFVEFFNRSEKFINLKNWTSANLVNDTIVNQKVITSNNIILEPLDFVVITLDPNTLKGEYLQSKEEKLLKASLPSLPDDEGSCLLLSGAQTIIDTVFYNDDQHSPFLKDSEGVSLERIDVNSSSASSNWHSASASSGYATPGLPNSNAFQNHYEHTVAVTPEIFSPQSGSPEFATINYRVDHTGYVANIKIINQQGRVIKNVAENELLGTEGFFTWSGDTTQGTRAANGAYMVWFEMFDVSGNLTTIKKRVVVAERF